MSTDDPLSPARGLERSNKHHSQPLSQGRPPLVGSSAHVRRQKQQVPGYRLAQNLRADAQGCPARRQPVRARAQVFRARAQVYGVRTIAVDRNSR